MAPWYIWITKTLFVEHSRQVKVFASRIFGIIVRNVHKPGQSFSVCDQSVNMKHSIFFCTCPRTGSRDSHTCVANYKYYSWNICGKLKHRLRREYFRFQRRAEIKRFILPRKRFNLHFSPKIRHILSPCDNCDIKNGRKRVKKFGQPWLTLTVQLFWYVY